MLILSSMSLLTPHAAFMDFRVILFRLRFCDCRADLSRRFAAVAKAEEQHRIQRRQIDGLLRRSLRVSFDFSQLRLGLGSSLFLTRCCSETGQEIAVSLPFFSLDICGVIASYLGEVRSIDQAICSYLVAENSSQDCRHGEVAEGRRR